jgi:hypothetical protein
MTTEDFINDIPLNVAIAAHSGTSFVPDERGRSERADYAATLAGDFARLAKLADTEEKQELLAMEFARYRAGYKLRTTVYLESRSRIMSTMITGPANFPVSRQEKLGRSSHNKLELLLDFRKRAIKAIEKKLCPELRPIMSGDSDAVERLTVEITEAEAKQAEMRESNALARKQSKAGGPVTAHYYQPFELSNNTANIRRMKTRLAIIVRAKQAKPQEVQGENAKYEDCPADNRVRLFFDGKPDNEIRTRLKSSGFRWAPSLGCWQAYRNDRTIPTARAIAGVA